MSNDLKTRLAAGEICIGAWLSVPSPLVADALCSCGFDWMAVDFEHGSANIDQAQAAFIAAERHGVVPFARLSSADPFLARRLLDSGAAGLIIPVVQDAQEFSDFARHCLYPPAGTRGVGLGRFNVWGDRFQSYLDDFKPILIPQIETMAGVAAADALAALPEVDGMFIGPYDLSADLGKGGDFKTPEFKTALSDLKDAFSRHGKALGIHQVEPDMTELKATLADGFTFVAYGTDLVAMRSPFQDLREQLSR